MDNSWVLFTIGSSGTPQKIIKSNLFYSLMTKIWFILEERRNYSLEQSPLRNKELSDK